MRTLGQLQKPSADQPPGLTLSVQRERTFDTPEFAGMTFLEVETKSALNHVKGNLGFNWSINPYRGCSHACSYCMSGDTSILMGDGRTKRLAEVRVGDAIYGTVRRGAYRRYVLTRVLVHWSTIKPAYRVTISDGTQLVVSGDHRLLTDRGWKHVTGAEHGPLQRPHLTLNNRLMGTGSFAEAPKKGAEYRRGYLCGMIRGDGSLGSYSYDRPGRASGDVYRFRLALADPEALQRSHRYLMDCGVKTDEYLFQSRTAARRELRAIRTQSRAGVAAVSDVIGWPTTFSDDWRKGFLAGIFDAEGSYSRGILRITNADPAIIDCIALCLRRFGFAFALERTSNGCMNVRIRGGLRQHLRFFHSVDPAITRKLAIEGRAIKNRSPLRVMEIKPLNIELPLFDISTGTGDFIADGVVSHNCFARPTHSYLNMSPLGDFERKVVVKTNVAEVLRRELARPSWRGEHVAMGTNTDPYQRCEGRYRLMPGIIAALGESLTPFSILTKGTMITRDVDVLRTAAERVDVKGALTVGMLDETLWHSAEPGTPSPAARLKAVRQLNEAGIPTGVMLAPIMPGLNDDEAQLDALIDAAASAGATHISPIVLHLRPGVRELFWPWLEREHADLVGLYTRLYQRSEASKEYRDRIYAIVDRRRKAAWRRHGQPKVPAGLRASQDRPKAARREAEQLRLL